MSARATPGALVLVFGVASAAAYEGSRFDDVRRALEEAPYRDLPDHRVTGEYLGSPGAWAGNRLLTAARRTLG